MPNYTKYRAYKKQRRAVGASTWEDVVPLTLSIDGDGTMRPIVLENQSEDCGYTPPIEPMYKWVDLDPSVDWICDDEPTVEEYEWRIVPIDEDWICDDPSSENDYKMIAYYQDGTEVVIPQNFYFYYIDYDDTSSLTRSNVVSCKINDSIKVIGKGALSGLTNLSSITFSENLTRIDNEAFKGCSSLKELELPKHLGVLDGHAFSGCTSLSGVNFSELDELCSCGVGVFAGAQLTAITVPSNLRNSNDSFNGLTKLKTLTYPSTTLGFSYTFDSENELEKIYIQSPPPQIEGWITFYGYIRNTNVMIYVPSAYYSAYLNTYPFTETMYQERLIAY